MSYQVCSSGNGFLPTCTFTESELCDAVEILTFRRQTYPEHTHVLIAGIGEEAYVMQEENYRYALVHLMNEASDLLAAITSQYQNLSPNL